MNRMYIFALIFTFATASVHMPATAGPVGNQQLSMDSELQLQRDEVRHLMDREDVSSALLAYGVSPADAQKRVDNMTESELRQMHDSMSSLPAGGDALGAVLTVILILILLEVIGVIDIFPRI